MTVRAPSPPAAPVGSVLVPAPPAAVSVPWLPALLASVVVLVVVAGAGAATGRGDSVLALVGAASVGVAHRVAELVVRRTADGARRRWLDALDATEAACDAQLQARRTSLLRLWPPSADLVERLRRGESPVVLGAPTIVVLGEGAVASGIALVGGEPESGVPHPRVVELRARLATLSDGPLCVDAAGGVLVRGPALLAASLAGGYRSQLRHRGAAPALVTLQVVGDVDQPAGGAGDDTGIACVVHISPRGDVVVVRRGGVPCEVPVVPSWTSLLDGDDTTGDDTTGDDTTGHDPAGSDPEAHAPW